MWRRQLRQEVRLLAQLRQQVNLLEQQVRFLTVLLGAVTASLAGAAEADAAVSHGERPGVDGGGLPDRGRRPEPERQS